MGGAGCTHCPGPRVSVPFRGHMCHQFKTTRPDLPVPSISACQLISCQGRLAAVPPSRLDQLLNLPLPLLQPPLLPLQLFLPCQSRLRGHKAVALKQPSIGIEEPGVQQGDSLSVGNSVGITSGGGWRPRRLCLVYGAGDALRTKEILA